MDISQIDRQIDAVHHWIPTAANALMQFHNSKLGVFWRDTNGLDRDEKLHPTSTNRAFFALFEYLRFSREEGPLENGPDKESVESTLSSVAQKYIGALLGGSEDDVKRARASTNNQINPFTDGHILVSISLLRQLGSYIEKAVADLPMAKIHETASLIQTETKKAMWPVDNDGPPDGDRRSTPIKAKPGGRIHADDYDIHDFVTLHSVRGVDVYSKGTGLQDEDDLAGALKQRIYDDVLKLLGLESAQVSSRFDAAELTFSTVLLERFQTPDASRIITKALDCIGKAQAEDGSWPTARIITYGNSRTPSTTADSEQAIDIPSTSGPDPRPQGRISLLHVSSYEVSLSIANLVAGRIWRQNLNDLEVTLPILGKSFELVKGNFRTVTHNKSQIQGWANDRARGVGVIESWAIAIVLTFLIRYHDLLVQLRQNLILNQYKSETIRYDQLSRKSILDVGGWLDLVPAFRTPDWIATDPLKNWSDPTPEHKLSNELLANVIHPIKGDPIQRPHDRGLIFYGPPGTRKTSLVDSIATSLSWPLVSLSPPRFLTNGLEGFEGTTAQVFEHMSKLRRVVILFDECEDFFRTRPENTQTESRTVGAFITSGMLPRIQRLKDIGWVIFVFASNIEPDDLDDAVTRLGRFDYIQKINHPTIDVQIEYVDSKVKDLVDLGEMTEDIGNAIKEAVSQLGQKNKDSVLAFSSLDRFIRLIASGKVQTDSDELLRTLQTIALEKRAPSLA